MDLIARTIKRNPKLAGLFFQLVRFGIIGVGAALVHVVVVVMLVEMHVAAPLIANIFAFLVSFNVSYWGHRYWTFAGTTVSHATAFPKLFLVASLALCINEGLFYLFLKVLDWPYIPAIIVVLIIIPMVTFFLNKLWVFKVGH